MSSTQSEQNQSKAARTWLTPNQIDKMRDAALTTGHQHLQERNLAIVELLADTGIRNEELTNIHRGWIDLEGGKLYLPSHAQKGSPPPATVGLSPETVRQLRRYLASEPWGIDEEDHLFRSSRSASLTTRAVRKIIKRIAIEADVRPQTASGGRGDPEDVHPHSLRHSVAYRIIVDEGGRMEDVQLKLRHASRQTTDLIYGHLVPR